MKTLIKQGLCISFILFGLFNQNLYAHADSFVCDFVRKALVWDVGTVQVSEIYGEITYLKESHIQLMAEACHVGDMGHWSVTIRMSIPRLDETVYKLPIGVDLKNAYTVWYSHLIHKSGKIVDDDWVLNPDEESKNYWTRDETSTFKAIMRGALIYHNSRGRIKEGPFNIKIGDADLEYGPSIPIYIKGSIQAQHICSVAMKNTTVIMPTIPTTAFHGINQPAGPKVPVAVDMNCSQDMPNISVRLNSVYTLNSQQGILSPDPTSTTQGIAIQLLDKQSHPIDLGKNLKSVTTDNRFHRIAMQAQYIQTGKTIKAGLLKSSVSFDVFYQ